MKLKPKKVDIGKLPVFRPLNADPKYSTLIEFYENVLKKTGRDRTVQRESVWRNILNKQIRIHDGRCLWLFFNFTVSLS